MVETSVNIVACQRGGVSNKPTLGSGQRQDTGSGIFGPFIGGLAIKKFKKRNEPYI